MNGPVINQVAGPLSIVCVNRADWRAYAKP